MAMREGKEKKWGKGGCSIMYVLVLAAEARPETESLRGTFLCRTGSYGAPFFFFFFFFSFTFSVCCIGLNQ
jgi:hypothetical protein